MLIQTQRSGFGGRIERGIGFRFTGISYSGLVSGGNLTTFANLVDGNSTTYVGDSNSGDNNNMIVTFYNIAPQTRFNLLRVFINGSFFPPGSGSAGRWEEVVVEGSNDTTTGSDGTWANIGWADGTTTKNLSAPPFDIWYDFPFNSVAPYGAYRFRQTLLHQFISIHEIELIAK